MELFDRQYWGFGVLNRFKDDWLVTHQAAKLFIAATTCVLALTPVFLGKIDPAQMSHWMRLCANLFGMVATVAIFFLWGGMLRYWIRIDQSGKWSKRLSLTVLVLGLWWGACLYCYVVYIPQVLRKKHQEA